MRGYRKLIALLAAIVIAGASLTMAFVLAMHQLLKPEFVSVLEIIDGTVVVTLIGFVGGNVYEHKAEAAIAKARGMVP